MAKSKTALAAAILKFLQTTEGYTSVAGTPSPKGAPCLLGMKRKSVTLVTVNNRSLFQPYENKVTKDIIIPFVVALGQHLPPYDGYIGFGCPWVCPHSMEEFEAFCKTL